LIDDYRRHAVAAVIAAMPVMSAVAAEAYPAKPVRLLVGIAPGGATDVQARWFAQKLTTALGRPFVVDNRSGAGGLIAYQAAVAAAPDGYTLLVTSPGVTIAAASEQKPIDPLRDTAPISLLTKAPFLVVVLPSLPVKTLQELIAYAKARPNEFVMATAGRTAPHMGVLWLSYATKSNMTIITYKGVNPALIDLLAGQVHATLSNVLTSTPHVKSGRLRALAVTSLQRTKSMPDLPTVAESGVPGYDVTTWNGWVAPRGTPAAIVMTLNRALVNAAAAPDIAERLAEDGGSAIGSSPAEFARHMADETARWEKLAKVSGLKLE
jgi:tripartite-type tricarboxylate transporter receptor subunit TctC